MNKDMRPIPVRTSESYGLPAGTAATGVGAHKVLRNTYMLLSMTLLFSALMSVVAIAVGAPYGIGLVCSLVSLGLLWFVFPRVANSEKGIYFVFLITGLLGFGLGPVINVYLTFLPNGGQLVATALGGTGAIFLCLSGYVLATKKDFSFMGGFLMTGLITIVLLSLGTLAAALFGVNVSMFALGLSAACMLLFSGLILFETSQIIHGGETNYVNATVSLYLSIYNLFASLLHLLGFAADE